MDEKNSRFLYGPVRHDKGLETGRDFLSDRVEAAIIRQNKGISCNGIFF